ncbi:hypothetical protein DFH09DRAFT_1312846 [Mycena vulgaris]|nr:hypothetical protein DFH09DRAFT_1312846 [Mycena vulgaris]
MASTARRIRIRSPLLPPLAPPFRAFQHRRLEGGRWGSFITPFQQLKIVSTWRLRLGASASAPHCSRRSRRRSAPSSIGAWREDAGADVYLPFSTLKLSLRGVYGSAHSHPPPAAPAARAAVPRLPASALGGRTLGQIYTYLPAPQPRLYVASTPRRFPIRRPLLPRLAPPFRAFQHRRLEGGSWADLYLPSSPSTSSLRGVYASALPHPPPAAPAACAAVPRLQASALGRGTMGQIHLSFLAPNSRLYEASTPRSSSFAFRFLVEPMSFFPAALSFNDSRSTRSSLAFFGAFLTLPGRPVSGTGGIVPQRTLCHLRLLRDKPSLPRPPSVDARSIGERCVQRERDYLPVLAIRLVKHEGSPLPPPSFSTPAPRVLRPPHLLLRRRLAHISHQARASCISSPSIVCFPLLHPRLSGMPLSTSCTTRVRVRAPMPTPTPNHVRPRLHRCLPPFPLRLRIWLWRVGHRPRLRVVGPREWHILIVTAIASPITTLPIIVVTVVLSAIYTVSLVFLCLCL